jgi:hypothetical protein
MKIIKAHGEHFGDILGDFSPEVFARMVIFAHTGLPDPLRGWGVPGFARLNNITMKGLEEVDRRRAVLLDRLS